MRIICPEKNIDLTYGPRRMPPPRVIEVIARTLFTFDGRTSGANQSIVLAEGIDAHKWVSAVMSIRLYRKNSWRDSGGLNGASAVVRVENTRLGADDPSKELLEANGRNDSTAIVSTTLAPLLLVSEISAVGTWAAVACDPVVHPRRHRCC